MLSGGMPLILLIVSCSWFVRKGLAVFDGLVERLWPGALGRAPPQSSRSALSRPDAAVTLRSTSIHLLGAPLGPALASAHRLLPGAAPQQPERDI
jgi:hypothetical protein